MLTNEVKKKAMAAFHKRPFAEYKNDPCYGILAGRKMFVIEDDKTNEWLCDHLGLNSDDNCHLVDGFVFDFSWFLQLWTVGA